MLETLGLAFGLMHVHEGLLPQLGPARRRQMFKRVNELK